MPLPKPQTISNLVEGGRALISGAQELTKAAESDFKNPDMGLKAKMAQDFVTMEVYVRQFELLLLGYIEGHTNSLAKAIDSQVKQGEVQFETLEAMKQAIETGEHLVSHFHEADIRNVRWAKEAAKRSGEERKRLKKSLNAINSKIDKKVKEIRKTNEEQKKVVQEAQKVLQATQGAANDATAYKKAA